MAFSYAQLEALEGAIGAGVLEVKIGDKVIKYQTMADLIKARDLVYDQLHSSSRSVLSVFDKN